MKGKIRFTEVWEFPSFTIEGPIEDHTELFLMIDVEDDNLYMTTEDEQSPIWHLATDAWNTGTTGDNIKVAWYVYFSHKYDLVYDEDKDEHIFRV